MKTSTLLFTSSFVAVVASGWARIDAGGNSDGPAAQPVHREIQIGDRTVALQLDRERVPSGQPIHLTLAATGSERRGLDVEVAVMEQTGSRMARSMPPPREVSRRTVHLASAPVELPLTLAGPVRGEGVDPLTVAGAARQYTIVVTGKGDAASSGGAWLPVFAYQPEAYRLTVTPPTAEVGQQAELAIEVESLVDKPLRDLTIGIGSNFLEVDGGAHLAELAPGEHAVVHVKVRRTATSEGQPLRIDVTGWAGYGGSSTSWVTVDQATGEIARGSNVAGAGLMVGMTTDLDVRAIAPDAINVITN